MLFKDSLYFILVPNSCNQGPVLLPSHLFGFTFSETFLFGVGNILDHSSRGILHQICILLTLPVNDNFLLYRCIQSRCFALGQQSGFRAALLSQWPLFPVHLFFLTLPFNCVTRFCPPLWTALDICLEMFGRNDYFGNNSSSRAGVSIKSLLLGKCSKSCMLSVLAFCPCGYSLGPCCSSPSLSCYGFLCS